MSKKIAIQGELGAYSHIAAENLYKDSEIKTCTTFEETFKQAYNDPSYKMLYQLKTLWQVELPIFITYFQNINYKFMENIFKQLNITYYVNQMQL